MRLAWFTPFSIKSAIGRCSRAITEELAKSCEVDILCFDSNDLHHSPVRLRRFKSHSEVSAEILGEYDIAVYNLGNYLPFHGDIYEVAMRHPGIIVLHDYVMHHFFAAYYLDHHKSETAYLEAVFDLYGKQGSAAAKAGLERGAVRLWESNDVGSYPFFEKTLCGALGVLTHSEFFARSVKARFSGPVRTAALPYPVTTGGTLYSRRQLGVEDNVILAVTIGHVNPNKRISDVLEALSRIASTVPRFHYAVLGACEPNYHRELQKTIEAHDLGKSVTLLGEVSEELLRSYLYHCDFCINLRFPPTEGASASAIEEMIYSKPILVADVGFYSELPDDCVLKVEPLNLLQLSLSLQILIQDRGRRIELGGNAGTFARTTFIPQPYVKELLELVSHAQEAKPLFLVTDTISAVLRQLNITADDPILDRLAHDLSRMFARNDN